MSRHKDPVTPELRTAVLERDDYVCVAFRLGGYGFCSGGLTLDHVQDGYGRMGKRAPSDMAHLVTLCARHHIDSGWATANRPLLREYLARVSPMP